MKAVRVRRLSGCITTSSSPVIPESDVNTSRRDSWFPGLILAGLPDSLGKKTGIYVHLISQT
jgi:hypothetical protein